MEETLNAKFRHYFTNFESGIHTLVKAHDKNSIIDIENVYHNLNHLFAGIEGFYKANPKHRPEGQSHCKAWIAAAKDDLKKTVYEHKDLRIEYLETIEEGVDAIFSKDLKTGKGKTPKDDSLSINQRVLILHYTGMLDVLNEVQANTNKSELLGLILNFHSQNIRQALTYINGNISRENSIKTKANLISVKEVFDNLKLTGYSNKVSADLKELDKKL